MAKYLPLAIFAYTTFNTPNLGNYSPYKMVFDTKTKLLLNLETMPDIKVSGTFKDYYEPPNNRLQYLHKLLQDFKSKRLAMINKDRTSFQYNSGDLVYIIPPPTSQLCTTSRKLMIKYLGPVVIYKIINPHNYLLMTLDGRILRGFPEHERLKPANIRTSKGNVQNLSQLKQVMNAGCKF